MDRSSRRGGDKILPRIRRISRTNPAVVRAFNKKGLEGLADPTDPLAFARS